MKRLFHSAIAMNAALRSSVSNGPAHVLTHIRYSQSFSRSAQVTANRRNHASAGARPSNLDFQKVWSVSIVMRSPALQLHRRSKNRRHHMSIRLLLALMDTSKYDTL